ncbi:MAG: hypothetical protein K0B87_03165 [Candidatus Syntrophosphaera sp.]|nr:hypothetical protein [Candidatus Syntrophosphaera sp.]
MKNWFICTLCVVALLLPALAWSKINLPDSEEPVLTEDNLMSGFTRVDPDDKKPETLITKAWLWQDGSDLVIRLEAQIDSTFTRGNLSVKDEGTQADYLRVQLITIPDAYYAYYYVAYPLGNLMDGVRDQNMNVDYAWNSRYSYTSEIGTGTWQVTMRIPLDELRYKQPAPYHWKIILTRYNHWSQEYFSLPYSVTKMGKDYFLQARDIVLTTPVRHKLDISLKPYFVKSYDLIAKTSSFDPEHLGLDIALNPGQRTRIKISLNPDFSDVPMDSAQDDYNSKHPPYYGENRFFFTEDIDAFGLDYDVLNTRNIVQPRLAFKATGNTKILNWGALGAFDKEIRDGEDQINPDDYFQALAINPNWRRFQMYNAVVSRVNKDYYNHVYSGSAKWEFLPRLYVSSVLNLSIRDRKDEALPEPQQGHKVGFGLRADPGDFDVSLGYLRLSKDLNYDAGYLYDKDLHYLGANINWNKTYAERKIRYLAFSAWAYASQIELSEDPMNIHSLGGTANLNLRSRLNFMANVQASRQPDLKNELHDNYNAMLGGGWGNQRNMGVVVYYTHGRTLIYALSEDHSLNRISTKTWYIPLKNLRLSLVAAWTRYGYPELNEVVINGDTLTVRLDSEYVIANAAVEYTPRATFKITLGSGLSSYESGNIRSSLTYYGNLRYEFKPEWFVFLGFKSAQTQIEPSSWQDPTGHFRKNLATAYAKVSVTL